MFSKKIEVVSSKTKKLEKTKNFCSYINKKVYSKKGMFVGKVSDVIMKDYLMVGVLVNANKKIFIGKEFFKSDSESAIMLKIDPVTEIIGKTVYDSTGKRLGKVVGLKRKGTGNSYSELLVKKAIYSRSFSISKKEVEIAKKSVILNKEYE